MEDCAGAPFLKWQNYSKTVKAKGQGERGYPTVSCVSRMGKSELLINGCSDLAWAATIVTAAKPPYIQEQPPGSASDLEPGVSEWCGMAVGTAVNAVKKCGQGADASRL